MHGIGMCRAKRTELWPRLSTRQPVPLLLMDVPRGRGEWTAEMHRWGMVERER